MKYYITEVTRYIEPVNGREEEIGVYSRDDENKAEILFHQKVASSMNNDNVAMALVYVKSEYGVDLPGLNKHYVNPATIPTPEPEVEPIEE